jgi:hypothetical protein
LLCGLEKLGIFGGSTDLGKFMAFWPKIGICFLIPYFCNDPQVQTDLHAKFYQLGMTLLAKI